MEEKDINSSEIKIRNLPSIPVKDEIFDCLSKETLMSIEGFSSALKKEYMEIVKKLSKDDMKECKLGQERIIKDYNNLVLGKYYKKIIKDIRERKSTKRNREYANSLEKDKDEIERKYNEAKERLENAKKKANVLPRANRKL